MDQMTAATELALLQAGFEEIGSEVTEGERSFPPAPAAPSVPEPASLPWPELGEIADWSPSTYTDHTAQLRAEAAAMKTEAKEHLVEARESWAESTALWEQQCRSVRDDGLKVLNSVRHKAKQLADRARRLADETRDAQCRDELELRHQARMSHLESFSEVASRFASEHGRVPLTDLWSADVNTESTSVIGRLGNGPGDLPVYLPVRSNVVFSGDSDAAAQAARSWISRLLACRPPGELRVRFADPTYMGNSLGPFFALFGAEQLAGKGPAVSTTEINQMIEWARARAAQVNLQALRGIHASIDEFNATSRTPEHYLAVVAFGVGGEWTAAQVNSLAHLAEMGPPCGVFVIAALSHQDTKDSAMTKAVEKLRSARWTSTLDGCTSQQELSAELSGVGPVALDTWDETREVELREWLTDISGSAVAALAPGVNVDALDGEAGQCSTDGLSIPIGIGANETISVNFGDNPVHGLVVGGTGSGKTTMLHTLIYEAARRYSPEELELWLVDLKEGVEFRQYADNPGPGLPHARVVACASDPEFALSVMEELVDEGKRRGDLFRPLEVRGVAGYRTSTGEALPRILCVIDECHLLLNHPKLADRAWQSLAWLAKEGRAFGIHLLLATQSLAGMGVHGGERSSVWRQIQMRLALQCSPADAELIFGEKNPAAKGLAPKGDGVLNNDHGNTAANVKLQVAYVDDDQALERRTQLTATQKRHQPQISFTGDRLAEWHHGVRDSPHRSVSLGRPLTLDNVCEIPLSDHQSIAFVGPTPGTCAVLSVAALELREQMPNATFTVIDGLSRPQAEQAALPAELASELGAKLVPAAALLELLGGDVGDVIVGFGLERMRVRLPDDWKRTNAPPMAQLLDVCHRDERLFLGAWTSLDAAAEQCGTGVSRVPMTVRVEAAGGPLGPLRGRVIYQANSGISRLPQEFIPWAQPPVGGEA